MDNLELYVVVVIAIRIYLNGAGYLSIIIATYKSNVSATDVRSNAGYRAIIISPGPIISTMSTGYRSFNISVNDGIAHHVEE